MNRYLLITYNITDTIISNGYYTFTDEQCQEIMEWYEDFNESVIIDNDIVITPDNFSIIEVEYDINCEKFISKYGNPCNILEHIDDLSHIMDSDYTRNRTKSIDTDDSDLLTGTENINQLINAHLTSNYDEVQRLIQEKNFDDEDDIVKKIIQNHE